MAEENLAPITKESLWYVDNYIVLIDYYDRTISRIAARCIRSGNIALEEYKFYPIVRHDDGLDCFADIMDVPVVNMTSFPMDSDRDGDSYRANTSWKPF